MVALKLSCILAAVTLVSASNIRGVDPEKYDLYNPSRDGQWTCLDGSKVISHNAVNDDYCDCPDGSDEPGTSACPNSLFYCVNEGHIPAYIKSYAVNDGVCDEACCDGSDETSSLIHCPNRCKEVGETYREQQANLKQSTQAGLAAKAQLITEAQDQITQWEEQETILQDEIILKKSNMLKLQRELNILESKSTTNKKAKCQSDGLDVATLKHDIVILQKELDGLKDILAEMKVKHNHNFHDMAVKSAISGYDEFMTRYESMKANIEQDLAHIDAEVSVQEEIEEELAEEEGEETVVEESTEEPVDEGKKHIHTLADTLLEKLESILPTKYKNTVMDALIPLLKKDEQPKENNFDGGISNEADVENARKLFQNAENEVNSLNSELEKVKQDLAVDYGKDKEWLKLKDVCVEKDEGEYTYSLCFLGDAYQKSNKDSTRTFLGKFEKFDGDKDLYKVHVHTHGTRCWNGPERSVKAKIECGLKNEILEVSEPEKCEYHYRMLSPAVCQSDDKVQQQQTEKSFIPIHEEL
ncbi:glucosidase II beta subunit-like-domain-containing protein [Thamnidium elegans]|nr:glucosidase II beta subunit-like-domain-containing protein [Thamnidium elegans]